MPQDPAPAPAEAGGKKGFQFDNTVFSGWQPFRDLRAVGPSRDPETLRQAYLGLLKLSLCDLTGSSTVSVWRDPRRGIISRELQGDDLQVRALGVDWPLQGLTMVGLNRLDDLQACVEAVVADGVEGDLIEAGTWRGGASIVMRATLDSLGDGSRQVVVADSFEGFPEPDEEHPDTESLVEVDYIAVPVEEVRANFARFGCENGVDFVEGFFQETMPGLRGRRWSVVRLDGDSYEATWLTLQTLYPGLAVGGYLIVDDYGALEECRTAVDEFREHHGIREELEPVDWTGVRWRRSDPSPIEDVEAPGGVAVSAIPQRESRQRPERRRHVPHMREAALKRKLAERDEELAQLRAALRKRGGGGLTGWVRGKLGRWLSGGAE